MKKFKRKVFYLSGFDPRGARYYHALMDEEAVKHRALTGDMLSISARKKQGGHLVGWEMHTDKVGVDYSFMAWDDIVRDVWVRDPFQQIWAGIKAYSFYIVNADWPSIFKLPSGPIITFYFPILTMLLLFIGSFAASYLAADLLQQIVFSGSVLWINALIGLVAGVWITPKALLKVKSLWLLQFFIFNITTFCQEEKALDERLDYFAKLIIKEIETGQADEIILAAHSNGSILAVPLMERLLEHFGDMPERFKMLTFGHSVPLINFIQGTKTYKKSLEAISQKAFQWIDISAPPDGTAYALISPFAPYVTEFKTRLLLKTPQFHKYYTPARYRKLKKNKFDLHFQYVMCPDKVAPLSYYQLLTTEQDLWHYVEKSGEA